MIILGELFLHEVLVSSQSKRYKRRPKVTRDFGSQGPGGERALSIPQITYDHIDDKDGVFSEESSGMTDFLFSLLYNARCECFVFHQSEFHQYMSRYLSLKTCKKWLNKYFESRKLNLSAPWWITSAIFYYYSIY